MAQLVGLIQNEVNIQAVARGFKKKSFQYIKDSPKDGFIDLLMVGYSTYRGVRGASIHVGVYYSEIEKLYMELLEGWVKPDRKAYFPMIREQIGYIQPSNKYFEWYFYDYQTKEQIVEQCNVMFSNFDEYAPAFYSKMSNLETVKQYYEGIKGLVYSFQEFFILLIIYLLEGNKNEGIRLLENALSGEMGKSEMYHTFYERYTLF